MDNSFESILAIVISFQVLFTPFMGLLWLANRQERQRLERVEASLVRKMLLLQRGRKR